MFCSFIYLLCVLSIKSIKKKTKKKRPDDQTQRFGAIGGDNAAVIWCSNRKKLEEEEEHRLSLWQRQLPICLALSTSVSIYIFIHIYIHFLLLTFTPLTNVFLYEMKVSAQRRVCVLTAANKKCYVRS